MKKLICLLLVVVMTCTVLSGCGGESTSASQPNESTTSTTQPLFPENPTIEHGDNFTQDDIDFLMHLHGQRIGGDTEESIPYSLCDVVLDAQRGASLYLTHFENPYYICGYKKSNYSKPVKDDNGNMYFDSTQYVWYKFYESQSIPEIIGDAKISSYSFLLYDCIIVKDLSNHIEYNYAYKYYLKCDYRADFYKHPSNMILYFGKTDISQYENKFIPAYTAVKKEYEIHIDENDVEYLFFKYKRFLPDGTLEYNYAKDFFYSDSGNFYNTLSPYFEILEETLESDGDLIQYAGIRLDILIQLEINE